MMEGHPLEQAGRWLALALLPDPWSVTTARSGHTQALSY